MRGGGSYFSQLHGEEIGMEVWNVTLHHRISSFMSIIFILMQSLSKVSGSKGVFTEREWERRLNHDRSFDPKNELRVLKSTLLHTSKLYGTFCEFHSAWATIRHIPHSWRRNQRSFPTYANPPSKRTGLLKSPSTFLPLSRKYSSVYLKKMPSKLGVDFYHSRIRCPRVTGTWLVIYTRILKHASNQRRNFEKWRFHGIQK